MQPGVRIRGRKGVALRKRRLRAEPLCRMCMEEGRVAAAEEVDHIVPLHRGGTDTDDNCRSLCREHHLRVTLGDRGCEVVEIGADGWPVE